jgi:hypothetical protein
MCGVLNIVACQERICALRAPTVFSARMKRVSARTGRRPRKYEHHSSTYLLLAVCVDKPPLRAARANRVFRADEKRIRTESTVIVNTKSRADGSSSAQHRNCATRHGAI